MPVARSGAYINCQVCGKPFYVFPSRVRTAKYCSKTCMTLGMTTRNFCEICGKRVKKPGRRFCSRECGGIGRRTGAVVKCETCGEKTYKSLLLIKSHIHHFCSRDCANVFQRRRKIEYVCKTCGEVFYLSPSVARQRNPSYCSIECRNINPEWRKNNTQSRMKVIAERRPNMLELHGRTLLTSLDVLFQEQVLIADKFLVDVLLPNEKIIIHWDGDYWHGHPRFIELSERQLKRRHLDKSQDRYLQKCGYRVLRFWESDVNNRPDHVKTIIKKELEVVV